MPCVLHPLGSWILLPTDPPTVLLPLDASSDTTSQSTSFFRASADDACQTTEKKRLCHLFGYGDSKYLGVSCCSTLSQQPTKPWSPAPCPTTACQQQPHIHPVFDIAWLPSFAKDAATGRGTRRRKKTPCDCGFWPDLTCRLLGAILILPFLFYSSELALYSRFSLTGNSTGIESTASAPARFGRPRPARLGTAYTLTGTCVVLLFLVSAESGSLHSAGTLRRVKVRTARPSHTISAGVLCFAHAHQIPTWKSTPTPAHAH